MHCSKHAEVIVYTMDKLIKRCSAQNCSNSATQESVAHQQVHMPCGADLATHAQHQQQQPWCLLASLPHYGVSSML
jgi:hypothetical protein